MTTRMLFKMVFKPKDEDGVDGRRVCGWDGWVCGLGAVGVSSIFGLVRRSRAFTGGLLTFALVSGLQASARASCVIFYYPSWFLSTRYPVKKKML